MSNPLSVIQGDVSRLSAPRDTSGPVFLVGFLDQGNLGLGYLSAMLRQHGYTVRIFDIATDPDEIALAAQLEKPVLIGFSLIFQFFVRRYDALITRLRSSGVRCHFTMGGHFPSLSYRDTLELVPGLDSVVRFEGEVTLLELADRLGTGREWRDVPGVAYRKDGEAALAAARPLVENLDSLPYPDREFTPEGILGRKAMPILASRGCARTCSFCSIHTFYRAAPGKVVRTRSPREVVREMRMLHEERDITIFLFQDDDFPIFGPVWRRWAFSFVEELHRSGLVGRVIWKMNCRADAAEPELLAAMRDAGLYLVYMGLESGDEEGLKTLHKQITVEQNLRAVDMLKQLGLMFEFGFMLFDPSSTFDSVRANVRFLRRIVGDGSASATFCRMLPYDGTPIKDELVRTNRLRGDVCDPGYDFLDPRLDAFYAALKEVVDVTGWIHGHRALSPQINWAWNEVAVLERLFPPLAGIDGYKDTLRGITRKGNEMLFRVVEEMAVYHLGGPPAAWSPEELRNDCDRLAEQLLESRDAFILRHQRVLLEALGERPQGVGAYA